MSAPHPARRLLAVLWPASLAAIAVISLVPVPETPPGLFRADLLAHVAIYAWLGLILGLLRGRDRPLLRHWLGLTAYGFTLEVIQALTPWRHFALDDAAANALGAFLGLWLGRRFSRRPGRPETAG